MLQEYFDWYKGQMLELVPERLRRPSGGELDALLIEPEGAGAASAITLSLRRGRKLGRLGRFPLDAHGLEAARRAATAAGGIDAIWLRLPAGLLLEKLLTLPLAAERELDRVVGYELDRETPFGADEVWWDCAVEQRDRAQGKLQVRLSLVPRAPLAELVAALAASGLRPTALDAALEAGGRRLLALEAVAARGKWWSLRALPLAAAGCGVLALLAIGLPFLRQSLAMAEVESRIAALQPTVDEAEALRRKLDSSGNSDVLQAERARLGDPVAVLAAVTALFPNDTYLTDFTMLQRQVVLNGQGIGPAKLIPLLSSDPAFKDPHFLAPTSSNPDTKTDGFSIGAEARP